MRNPVAMAAQQRRVSARIEAARQPQNAASSQPEFDVSAYLNRIHEIDKDVARSSTEAAALEALDTTKGHNTRQHRLERSFLTYIEATVTTDGTPKWAEVMKRIPNPNYNASMSNHLKEVPLLYVLLSGGTTMDKKKLVNNVVIDWQMYLKKTRFKDGECPYYECEVQNMEFRAFLSFMAKTHGWFWCYSDFSNFDGSLNAVMKTIYNKRFEEWASGERYL